MKILIKLIVTDMNKTFLNEANRYDEIKFAKTFQKMKQQNVNFAVASGGPNDKLQNLFIDYQDQMDFISQNGSVIYRGSDLVHAESLSDDQIKQTLKMLYDDFGPDIVGVNVSGLKHTYVDKKLPEKMYQLMKQYYSNTVRVDDLSDISSASTNDQLVKVGVTFKQVENVMRKVHEMRQMLPSGLESLNSGFNTDLIGTQGVDKATGVRYLMKKYDANPEEVVTFGDNENDLGMLRLTPNSYAMKNGIAEAKDNAGHVTEFDNRHDGVLRTIDNILDNQ
ncbi:HAD superfamily hydrolase [Fructilactobacillus fructivorans]|nr:HAD superfamily hydrolase [Fructilactobacillus fructivorans]